jgi:acetyl esterase/lipase
MSERNQSNLFARKLLAFLFALGIAAPAAFGAETAMYTITLDDAQNGSFTIQPPLPENKQVAAGTELTVKATPAAGYALDCIYYIGVGNQGKMYYENASPEWKMTIDGNRHIGASFIEQKAVEGFTVKNDIVFAQPGVKKLKYDVFSPNNAKNLPCIIIIHGGGWAVNNEDVMRGLARELVRSGSYVVVSADYRWIRTGDGDKTPVTMANIIEDVYGAIVHVQEHAAEYGADPTRLAVTGDSAGGHLSAAALNLADRIGDQGFGVKSNVYQFKPTYLPKGKSIEQVRKEVVSALKAAAPSYGVFSEQALGRNAGSQGEALKAVAPQSSIPNVKDRAVPQFLLRGTVDTLIQDAAVQSYADALKAAGQRAEYVQVPGAAHAFLDWKPDARTKATFYRFGVPYAAKMKEFFDSVFYPKP